MSEKHELEAASLATRCDPETLGFDTTRELDGREVAIGQDRAVEALRFGLDMRRSGFNVFVLGPTGSGRARLAHALVEQSAADDEVPQDCCYVHNFEAPRKPRALLLPPGQGTRLRDHMERVVDELSSAIPAVFESQSYRERKEAIEQDINQRHEAEIEAIVKSAREHDVAVVRTPTGFALAPMREGKVLDSEEQEKLTEEEQKHLEEQASAVHDRLHEAVKRVPQLQREQRERV
ncbi:MAG: AAA family ATPase, partial [Myxococcales bacterium]